MEPQYQIVTLTLNPAFDVHATCLKFKEEQENIADISSIQSGGKGINVSRALKVDNIISKNIVILGKENSDNFVKNLQQFNLNILPIIVPGRIRENYTVHPKEGKETRLSFTGFNVNDNIINEIFSLINNVNENTIIDFSGSNPNGLSKNLIIDLIKDYKKKKAKIIIDSRSFSLNDLIEIKPFLIKPNIPELNKYYKKEFKLIDDIKNTAIELYQKGISNVMITLGEEGALLINEDGIFKANIPKVKVKSTIGAGDATIAGFIVGFIKGLKSDDILKTAVSYGTASVLEEGTLPPTKENIDKIMKEVVINKL